MIWIKGISSHIKSHILNLGLFTSNDLIKKNRNILHRNNQYPELVISRYRQVDNREQPSQVHSFPPTTANSLYILEYMAESFEGHSSVSQNLNMIVTDILLVDAILPDKVTEERKHEYVYWHFCLFLHPKVSQPSSSPSSFSLAHIPPNHYSTSIFPQI